MFFNRKQPQTTTATPEVLTSPTSARADADPRWQVAGRRAVALGMAVQLALPIAGLTAFARSARAAGPVGGKAAGSTTAQPTAGDASSLNGSDAALRQLFGTATDGTVNLPALSASADAAAATPFARSIDHLRAGEYEQAVSTLAAIPTGTLSDADSLRLEETLTKAHTASRQQQKARAELLVAQESAAAGQAAQAAKHYRAAGSNLFADADTRHQAGDGALRLLSDTNGAALVAPTNALAMSTEMQDAPAAAPTTAPATAPTADAAPATPAAPATAPAVDATPAPAVTPAPAAATPVPATPAPATPVPEPQPATPAPAVVAPVPVPVAPAPAPMPMPTPAPVAAVPDEQSAAQKALEGAGNYQKIKTQLQQYQATKLVEKARGEYAANQKHDALVDYSEAARLDPQNQQALSGRDETASQLGLDQQAPLVRSQDQITVRIQAIRYQFNSDLQKAGENVSSGKFLDAQHNIDDARVARNQDPTLFTTPQLNEFDTRINNAEVELHTAEAKKTDEDIQSSTEKTRKTETERAEEFERDKRRTVESLIQSARQYQEQGQYRQALAAIDQIGRIDPTNQYALGTRQMVLDKATAQEQREYREKFDREFEKVLNAADEKEIPYSDVVHYADDWPTLSEQRDKEVQADRGEGDQDTALQAQLDRHLPEVRFNANALSDVIDFLRDVTGANIYVDWKALEAASIARDAPVTARLRDIKFSKALELIFKSVNGDDDEHKLGYTIDEGVITISTRKELNKNTVTRRYDINDLLFVAPDYNNAPQLDLQSANQGQSAGGGGGGGGGGQSSNLFSGNTQQDPNQQQNNREQRIDEIKQYIQQNVDANSWKDAGGDVGTVSSSPLRAILLITQTPENQHKIVSVLDSLRASQALQVSIETRFLTVQRNFLEDIGVDADMTFNPLTDPSNPRSGYNSSRFSPITIAQNQVTDNSTFVDANGNVVANSAQGSRNLDWASAVGNASVPGSIAANPADYPNPIVIRGSYLDNLTVSFLIRAVEANVHSTTLTAPRLTLFSGQRSVLIVETQQAYVSDVTPVVAPGAALFDPTVSTTVATGVVLSVQATVSPDRKYVFLDLQPQLARLRALASFTISAVVQPTTTTIGTAAAPQVISGTIQLPTIDVTQVRTSVSVPDGATLLLGGQTLAGETTREQGVPVLSKIPFIKRLFTNRANAQDEQILLILVKPTILIQREQEQKQFPQLSSKLTGTGT